MTSNLAPYKVRGSQPSVSSSPPFATWPAWPTVSAQASASAPALASAAASSSSSLLRRQVRRPQRHRRRRRTGQRRRRAACVLGLNEQSEKTAAGERAVGGLGHGPIIQAARLGGRGRTGHEPAGPLLPAATGGLSASLWAAGTRPALRCARSSRAPRSFISRHPPQTRRWLMAARCTVRRVRLRGQGLLHCPPPGHRLHLSRESCSVLTWFRPDPGACAQPHIHGGAAAWPCVMEPSQHRQGLGFVPR